MLSAAFQQDIPLSMFVFPASTTVQLPPLFAEHAVAGQPATRDGPGRHRRSSASVGSRSGPTSFSASRRTPLARRGLLTLALASAPLAFALLFFVYPLGAILVAGLAPGGTFEPAAIAAILGRSFVLETCLVHPLAGGPLDRC